MKKNIFIISLVLSVISVILIFTSDFIYDYCIRDENCLFWGFLEDTSIPFILVYYSIPIFIFSLITYFLKDQIFQTWFKFSRIWVPISILLTIITPGGSASFFVSLWDKQMTAIVMSGLYIVISLMIIIIRSTQEYLLKKKTL